MPHIFSSINCSQIYFAIAISACLLIFGLWRFISFEHFYLAKWEIANSTEFLPHYLQQLQKIPEKPIILAWNKFWAEPIYEFAYMKWGDKIECPYKCQFTENKSLEQSATVIMFHGANPLGELPQHRRSDQLYTFLSHESPPLTSPVLFELPNDFFNLTITYRRDSTISIPYEELQEIGPDTPPEEIWSEGEIAQRISRKNRLALQFVSNCFAAPSGRESLIEQLRQHIEIDQFGKCNGLPCDEQCYESEMDTHFFYLALENSVCADYVTEKFWHALRRLVVPVVLKRKILRDLGIPDNSFIAADDFPNPRALAQHLREVQNDPTKYASYFNWTRKYRKNWDHSAGRRISPNCQLCEFALKQAKWRNVGKRPHMGSDLGNVDKRPQMTVDMANFWGECQCKPAFVQNVLLKNKNNS